jgi:hypothetical protein
LAKRAIDDRRVTAFSRRIEDDGIEVSRGKTSARAERHFYRLCNESAARLRYSAETQARFAVGDGSPVLLDGDHRIAPQSEWQRKQAGTGIQIED